MSYEDDADELFFNDVNKERVDTPQEAARRWGDHKFCGGLERDGCGKPGMWIRQNTRYQNDRSNWVFLCEDCAKMNSEYWAEMWSEYYSGRL